MCFFLGLTLRYQQANNLLVVMFQKGKFEENPEKHFQNPIIIFQSLGTL
jgi:hypothetical protein